MIAIVAKKGLFSLDIATIQRIKKFAFIVRRVIPPNNTLNSWPQFEQKIRTY